MKKEFKGYIVDECGHVEGTEKSNLDVFKICCEELTGHRAKIVSKRENDIEVTYYELNGTFGNEVYYYYPGTWDIKYSRNYFHGNGLPRKYEKIDEELRQKFREIFGE